MVVRFIKRHKIVMFISIFFYYLGYSFNTLFNDVQCANITQTVHKNEINEVYLDKVEYAVVVMSAPDHLDKRNAIRSTWAKYANNVVFEHGLKKYIWNSNKDIGYPRKHKFIKFLFIIGTYGLRPDVVNSLRRENNTNDDLLLIDNIYDSYHSLSLKLLFTLKWIGENLKNLKYLIKCDDDVFARVDLIIKNLEDYGPQMNGSDIMEYVSYKDDLPSIKGLYWGYFQGKATVFRNGIWKEMDWFLCNTYLPYAVGGTYIISHHIVNYIGRNYDILSYYKSEDVSMGVWTAALKGINRVHDIRFDTEWVSRGCLNNMLVRHKQSPEDMYLLYKTLKRTQGKRLCEVENVNRSSYKYNWNVLPRQCCSVK